MPHRRRGRFDLAMPSARAGAATVLHKRNQTGGKMITTEDRIRALPCWTGAIEIEPLQGGLSNANYLVKTQPGGMWCASARTIPSTTSSANAR